MVELGAKAFYTDEEAAKMLNDDGKKDRAIIQLKFILKKYDGTKASKEAKELLGKLEK